MCFFTPLSQSETALDPLQGTRFGAHCLYNGRRVGRVKKIFQSSIDLHIDELKYEWREKRHMKSKEKREREREKEEKTRQEEKKRRGREREKERMLRLFETMSLIDLNRVWNESEWTTKSKRETRRKAHQIEMALLRVIRYRMTLSDGSHWASNNDQRISVCVHPLDRTCKHWTSRYEPSRQMSHDRGRTIKLDTKWLGVRIGVEQTLHIVHYFLPHSKIRTEEEQRYLTHTARPFFFFFFFSLSISESRIRSKRTFLSPRRVYMRLYKHLRPRRQTEECFFTSGILGGEVRRSWMMIIILLLLVPARTSSILDIETLFHQITCSLECNARRRGRRRRNGRSRLRDDFFRMRRGKTNGSERERKEKATRIFHFLFVLLCIDCWGWHWICLDNSRNSIDNKLLVSRRKKSQEVRLEREVLRSLGSVF